MHQTAPRLARVTLAVAGFASLALSAPAASLAASPAEHAKQVERGSRLLQARDALAGSDARAGAVPACEFYSSAQVVTGGVGYADAYCNGDAADGPIRMRVTKLPDHGLVDVFTDSRFLSYAPDAGFAGTDTIKYVVGNNAGDTAEQTVTFNVTGAAQNTAPQCPSFEGELEPAGETMMGHVPVRAGSSRTISGFCFDHEGDAITLEISDGPSAGTLVQGTSVNGYPTLVYTAGDAAEGTKVQATITPRDAHGAVASASKVVGFEIIGAEDNSAPVCFGSSENAQYWFSVETGDTERAYDAYCSDYEGDAITYTLVTQPTGATATGSTSGVTVTPSATSGTASFTYKGVDSRGAESAVQTVSFNIAGVHSAPSCTGKNVDVAHAARTAFFVECGDVDNDPMSVYPTALEHGQRSVTKGGHMEIGRFADGKVQLAYTPRAGFNGDDGFKMELYDSFDEATDLPVVTLKVAAAGGSTPGGSTPGGSTPGGSTPTITPEQAKAAMTTLLTNETLDFLKGIAGQNKKGIDPKKPVLSLGTLGPEQLPNGGTGAFEVYDKPAGKKASASAAKRKKLGSTKVVVAKGQKKAVKVKLNSKGKSLLKKKGKIKLTVDATLTDALTGAQVKQSRTVTFKVKKKKK